MTEAALALLASLDEGQRSAACFPFVWSEGDGSGERGRWFYTPTDHGGLPLAAMTATQHRLVHRLVATGLSEAGYVTVSTIMGLENVLDRLEGWSVHYERERGRDPLLYWVAVFGDPAASAAGPGPDSGSGDGRGAAWGWRFGGHHVSLSYTVIGGEVVSTTPAFLGADPASSPLLGPHLLRPLAAAEDLGRELVHALNGEQRAAAVLSPVAPTDLVTGNRSVLADGDRLLGLPEVWRGRFEASLDGYLSDVQAGFEAKLGLTDEHVSALAFTAAPKGVSVGAMSADQREILQAVLEAYLTRLPDDLADRQREAALGGLDGLSFCWAGSIEPGEPHYYRIQGGDLLVEYDNAARDANHVHTVWRDLSNDFARGFDPLAHHHIDHHHIDHH